MVAGLTEHIWTLWEVLLGSTVFAAIKYRELGGNI
jgi:hypothetical protein